MGVSTAARIPKTAESLALCAGESTTRRNIWYPSKISQSKKKEVSLASQVHQIPQTGLAQSMPVIRPIVPNSAPNSAAVAARMSHSRRSFSRNKMLQRKTKKVARKVVQLEDT